MSDSRPKPASATDSARMAATASTVMHPVCTVGRPATASLVTLAKCGSVSLRRELA